MDISFVVAARASQWAAVFTCSLCFAMPCAASPFADHADGPPSDIAGVAAATESIGASDADLSIASSTPSRAEILPAAPLPADISAWSARGLHDERPPGDSVLRVDSLAGMLDPLLGPGMMVPAPERAYPALPGMASTPVVLATVPALRMPVTGDSPASTWRETGFNVMRWTSAALAVLAVVGVVMVLAMPGLRRRLFFPDMPQMPPRPA